MTDVHHYSWEPVATDAIALTQSFENNKKLVLNGSLSAGGVAVYKSIVRSVSITSVAGDTSLWNFKVSGFNNGYPISETIPGTTQGLTSQGTRRFSQITEVLPIGTPDDPTLKVSVGSGTIGQTQNFLSNMMLHNPTSAFQVAVSQEHAHIAFSFFYSLAPLLTLGPTPPETKYLVTGINTVWTSGTPGTASGYQAFTNPFKWAYFKITENPEVEPGHLGALDIYILQQGVIARK